MTELESLKKKVNQLLGFMKDAQKRKLGHRVEKLEKVVFKPKPKPKPEHNKSK